jgi:hypothetical protein
MLLESSDLVDNPPLSDSKTIRTSFPGIASRPLYELLPNTSPDASDEYDAIDDDILTDVWDELFAQIGGVKKLPHRLKESAHLSMPIMCKLRNGTSRDYCWDFTESSGLTRLIVL